MKDTIKLKSDYEGLLNTFKSYQEKIHKLSEKLREVVDFECCIVEELPEVFYLLIEDGSDRKVPLNKCLDIIEKKGRLSEEDFEDFITISVITHKGYTLKRQITTEGILLKSTFGYSSSIEDFFEMVDVTKSLENAYQELWLIDSMNQ